MKVTLNWLKEFVDFDLAPRDLADRLTHAGLEVESVQAVGDLPDSVVTVKILKMEKHPNADRLTLCQVSLGGETREIVCGAKNMKEGDVVALAQPGTVLPDGKKIERSTIRGATSEGMLCSEKELGFSPEAEGLMILPPSMPLGRPLAEALKIKDTVFEINVTPNRSDCLSVLGVAREIASLTGARFKPLEPSPPSGSFSLKGELKVELKEAGLCPRYTARVVKGVRIGPSPFWVQERLKHAGIRSINNIVDATNYAMLETGQPLHAFDSAKIAQGTIRIERAQGDEPFQTLDEIERKLNHEDLVIADPEKRLAIAGVMGGLHSGVTEATHTLVLESAYFDPASVRRTSKKLGLSTESSYRFERGVDPNGVRAASDRLAQLIVEWAGGELSKEVIDEGQKSFEGKKVTLRRARLHTLLGVDFKGDEVESALSRLQFIPKRKNDEAWDCVIPTARGDITREVDLVEEVARVLGYGNIPALPPPLSLQEAKEHDRNPSETKIRHLLAGRGFSEAIHYSFCSEKEITRAGLSTQELIRLSNPLSEEMEVMRPSLIPSLLVSVQSNLARQNQNLRLYEIRSVYRKEGGKVKEPLFLAFALEGLRFSRHWAQPKDSVDFFDGKGLIEAIWRLCGLPDFELAAGASPFLHPGLSARLFMGGETVGDFGALHPAVADRFEIESPVVAGELNLSKLFSLSLATPRFESLPRFPSVERDLTLIAAEDLPGEAVILKIRGLNFPWIREVKLFDVYRGPQIGQGKKALTYAIRYQDYEKTLTDLEVNQRHTELVEKLKTLLPIEWR